MNEYIPSHEFMPSDARPVCLMDAKPHHCRFVIGPTNGPHTIFCGAMTKGSTSYCPFHLNIVYTPPQRRRR